MPIPAEPLVSETADFVAAVRDDPDDDRPRLVLADWFEERGEEPRARFTRLQVEAVRHPWGTRKRIDLLREAEELRFEHENDWLGPWKERLVRWRWHRGLVHEATLTADVFAEHGAELFATHLVDRIGFCDRNGDPLAADAIPAVVGHPAFAHVRSLDVLGATPVRPSSGGWHGDFREPQISIETWLQRIADNESLTSFREFRPGARIQRFNEFGEDSGVDPAPVEAFCRATHLANVTQFDLRGCPLAEVGGRERVVSLVAQAPFAANLVRLGLEPWRMRDAALLRIAGDAVFGRLRRIDFTGYGSRITPVAREAVFHSDTLRSLCFASVEEGELAAYSQSPLARRVRALTVEGDFDENHPTDARESWRRLAETAAQPRILGMVCYDPAPEILADLVRSPWLRRVRSFVVQDDSQSPGFGETTGVARLLRSNSMPRLTRLRLHEFADQPFRDAISDWPGLARLEQLELTDDYFGRARTPLLASLHLSDRLEHLGGVLLQDGEDVERIVAAEVRGIRELGLGFSGALSPAEIRRLFEALAIRDVETLSLGFNPYEPTTREMPTRVYRVLADPAVLPRLQTVRSWIEDEDGGFAALRERLGPGLKR